MKRIEIGDRDLGWFPVRMSRAPLPQVPRTERFRLSICPPGNIRRVFRDHPNILELAAKRYVVYEFHPYIGEFYIADFSDEATALDFCRETYGAPC